MPADNLPASPKQPAAAAPTKATTAVRSKLFEDYAKVARDFMKKPLMNPGEWKYESKVKGPDDRIFVAPRYENGAFSVDVNYNNTRQFRLLSKLNVTTAAKWKLTTKVPFCCGSVEVETTAKGAEVTGEGKWRDFTVTDKITTNSAEATVAYSVAKHCSVGAYANYYYNGNTAPFTFGIATRYIDAGRLLSAFVSNGGQFGAAAMVPFTCPFSGHALAVSAVLDGSRARGITKAEAAVEGSVCSALTVRAKVTSARDVALCFIHTLPNRITGALTVQCVRNGSACCPFNVGVSLTQE